MAAGLGDRWLAGEPLPGVAFRQHDRVAIATGSREGQQGTVLLLIGVQPEPGYLVRLADGVELRVRQSALRAAG